MNSRQFQELQEAYLKVVENQQLDEAKEDSEMFPVGKRQVRNNRIRSDETTTEPELQTSRRVMHTAMRGQKKPEAKSRPTGSGKYGAMNRRGMSTSDKFRKEVLKRGMEEEVDLYDIILSHLLDEGFADTEQAATAIMVNMSEEWRESIVEEYKDLPVDKMIRKAGVKQFKHGMSVGSGASSNPKVAQQVGKMSATALLHDPERAQSKSKMKKD